MISEVRDLGVPKNHMRLLPTILSALLIAVLAGTATAGDPDDKAAKPKQSAVEQLRPEELAALKRKLPNWDELDANRQQRIAKGVLRLRDMTPEQRKQFERRLEEIRRAKGEGRDPAKEFAKWRGAKEQERREWHSSMKLAKGVGMLIREQLGEATWKQIKSHLPVHQKHLEMAFHRLFSEALVTHIAETVTDVDPATLNKRYRGMFERKQKLLAKATDDAQKQRVLRHMAHLVARSQAASVLEGVTKPKLDRAQLEDMDPQERRKLQHESYTTYMRAIGAASVARWPAPFAAAVTEIKERAQDPEKFAGLLGKIARQTSDRGAPWMKRGNPVMQLLMIEANVSGLPNADEIRANLRKAARGILIGGYKATPEAVDAAFRIQDPRKRYEAIGKLLGNAGKDVRRPWRRGAKPGNGMRRGGDK